MVMKNMPTCANCHSFSLDGKTLGMDMDDLALIPVANVVLLSRELLLGSYPWDYLVLTLATMSGCLVASLHPFYKEKDKIYEESLEGAWIDEDSCIWNIEPHIASAGFMSGKTYHDSSYVISFFEEEEGAPSILRGTLFNLDGIDYVDFFPDPNEDHHTADLTAWHHVPVHTLARVQYNSDSILLYWFAEEWLTELFEQNRIRIKHETIDFLDYERQLLTASTDELQKFIKKYGLKDLKNRGRYYSAKIIEPNGKLIDEVLIDKQNGVINSLHRKITSLD